MKKRIQEDGAEDDRLYSTKKRVLEEDGAEDDRLEMTQGEIEDPVLIYREDHEPSSYATDFVYEFSGDPKKVLHAMRHHRGDVDLEAIKEKLASEGDHAACERFGRITGTRDDVSGSNSCDDDPANGDDCIDVSGDDRHDSDEW